MDAYVIEAKSDFEKCLKNLEYGLSKLRSGRANPALLEGIKCDYYGEKMDISSLCSISMPEPRQIYVKPYSREDLKSVGSAIAAANIGINPQIEADGIRLIFPPLTEDIRKETAKRAKVLGEEAKVAIRNVRRDTLSLLKDDDSMSDDYKEMVEKDLQKEVDAAMEKVEAAVAEKQKEIMSI